MKVIYEFEEDDREERKIFEHALDYDAALFEISESVLHPHLSGKIPASEDVIKILEEISSILKYSGYYRNRWE